MLNRIALVVVTCLSIGSVACSKKAKSEPSRQQAGASATAGAADPNDPNTLFKSRCVVCHGDGGKGDGPGAAALTPKPRAFGDAEWQASVGDDAIAKTIVGGGAAVGKSPTMPPNADLKDKPEVVAGLVKIVRNFR